MTPASHSASLVHVAACPHPFLAARVDLTLPQGLTIAQMIEVAQPDTILNAYAHVFIGGEYVAREYWHLVRPRAGVNVTIRVVPMGGGGGKKNPLRTILQIAVIAVSFYLGPQVGMLLGISETAGVAIGLGVGVLQSAIGGAVVSLVGGLLVNAIAPPPSPNAAATFSSGGSFGGTSAAPQAGSIARRDSPTLAIAGSRNSAFKFGIVPRVLGKHKMKPPLAAEIFTELSGDDQFLRQIFCWGIGPIVLTNEKIGETSLGTFNDVETEFRRGYQPDQLTAKGTWNAGGGSFPSPADFGDRYAVTGAGTVDGVAFLVGDIIIFNGLGGVSSSSSWDKNGDRPLSLYPKTVHEDALAISLTQVGSWQSRTSQIDADELSIDITFPRGLVEFDDPGERQNFTVSVDIEYSLVSPTNWIAAGTITTTAKKSAAIRRGLVWNVTRDQYKVRLRRTTPDNDEARVFDDVSWTQLRTITNEDPVNLVGVALTAMRIKATDQLSGIVDQYSGEIESIVLDYSGSWQYGASSNPASLFRTVLQDAGNARPLADGRLDLTGLEDWHTKNVALGREFNQVIDFNTSVRALLADIASAGRARPVVTDGKWGVVIDEVKTTPIQHFTPRNSWGYTGEKTFAEFPHAFRVRFANRDKSWSQDERIVYDDGYDASNATKFEGLSLTGTTDSEQIWEIARYHIATGRLRSEKHKFYADVEHLVCTKGDLIRFTHDVPLFGLSAGRVKSVADDGASPTMATAVTLDEILTIENGRVYSIRFRLADGSTLLKVVDTVVGDSATLTFSTPFPIAAAPAPGDLAMFGETGSESVELIIQAIEPAPDLAARLVCVDHAPAVHNAGILSYQFVSGDVDTGTPPNAITITGHKLFAGDSVRLTGSDLPDPLLVATDYFIVNRTTNDFGLAASSGAPPIAFNDTGSGNHTITRGIPAYQSQITSAINLKFPEIGAINSDFAAMVRNADGSLTERMLVTIRRPAELQASIIGAEIAFKLTGDDTPFQILPVQTISGEISIFDVEGGLEYDVKVRYVTATGDRSVYSAITTHTVIGKGSKPADVVSFSVQQTSAGIVTFKWDQVPDLDRDGYIIKYMLAPFVWDDALLVTGTTKGTLVTNSVLPPGTWAVGIKAVDTSGNESENAVTASVTLENDNDIISVQTSNPRWPGVLAGLLRHDTSGSLIPHSTVLAVNMTDAELWDQMVSDPVTNASYTGLVIDLLFDANGIRTFGELSAPAGPGEGASGNAVFQIDYRDAAGAFAGFEDWLPSFADFRYLKARVRFELLGGAVYLKALKTTADAPEREETTVDEVVGVGGLNVIFAERFNLKPNVQVTADAAGSPVEALFPIKSAVSVTGFTVYVFNSSGSDVGGLVDWRAFGP